MQPCLPVEGPERSPGHDPQQDEGDEELHDRRAGPRRAPA
jgi:hypothetical protein